MKPDAVLFDAGLTLLRIHPSFWDVFVAGLRRAGLEPPPGIDPAVVGELWREHDRAWRAAGQPSPHIGDPEAERAYWQGLYRRYLEALEVEGDHEHAAAVIYEHFLEPGVFVAYPEVPGVVAALRAAGVRLGVVSNWGPWLRAVLDHEGLSDAFDVVVVSGEVGVEKPDPRIFELALQDLGTAPGPHVVYVGDDPAVDVEGATRVGLRAILLDRGDVHPDHPGPRVRDLTELLTLVTGR